MKVSNKHPMVLIRAVTVLSFGLALTAQSLASCPVAGNTVAVTDVDVRDFDGSYTAFSGVSLATIDFLGEAQRIAELDASAVEVVAAPEETEEPEEVEEIIEESTPEENSDIALLARLIQSEAGGLDIKEQAAVALTVLYRCDSSRWPDTVSGNIYKANQYATPSGSYSEQAYQAAELAYTLWSEGRGGEILPSSCMSFFGNGCHNYFYDSSMQIYNMPGVSTPSDIYDQMHDIIPALRRSAEQQAEVAENLELTVESDEEDDESYPDSASEDSAQLEVDTPSYENNEEINVGVSQGSASDEQTTLSSGQSSETSEIPSDTGNIVTAQ